jgi:hypothetical protein
MAKEKVTITVDRRKLDEARELAGASSASAAIDEALTCFVATERLRRDIAAYTRTPPTDDEVWLGLLRPGTDDLADDTDWDALYEDTP